MPEPDLYLVFVEPFNRAGISYMVTDSIAGIFYGEPRMTHDVDLVVELDARQIGDLVALFPADTFYCPPETVIRTEVRRDTRGHFNLIHRASGFKADVYPVGQDPLHKWAMSRRRVEKMGGDRGPDGSAGIRDPAKAPVLSGRRQRQAPARCPQYAGAIRFRHRPRRTGSQNL